MDFPHFGPDRAFGSNLGRSETPLVNSGAQSTKSMTELASFDLPCNLGDKWRRLWRDDEFYRSMLQSQGDIDITINKWEQVSSSEAGTVTMTRTVLSAHPVKASFPGMVGTREGLP